MQLFCPSCQVAFGGATHCPKCGGRLLSPQESFVLSGPPKLPRSEISRPTMAGRILIGFAVAIGAMIALRELSVSVLFLENVSREWWSTPVGIGASLFVRALGTIIGAVLAGAGREGGWVNGGIVGVCVGMLTGIFDHTFDESPVAMWQVACGAIYPILGMPAGMIGTWKWPAAVSLPEATVEHTGSSLIQLAVEDKARRQGRPMAWIRIAIGSGLASMGVIASDDIRVWLSRFSDGAIHTGGAAQSAQVGLEIATIVLAVGGVLAGASTGAGVRHGALAAAITMAGLFTAAAGRGDNFPAFEGYFAFLDYPGMSILSPAGGALVAMGVGILMTLSGWIGGQLFPPLVPRHMRHRIRKFEQA